MFSRWAELPQSSAGAATVMPPAGVSREAFVGAEDDRHETLLAQLGRFICQDQSSGSRQIYCVYHNLSDANTPIRLVCELGCCLDGCCAIDEYVQRWTTDYSWAALLLVVFVACVLVSSLIIAALYCFNRRRRDGGGGTSPAHFAGGSDCGASTTAGDGSCCYHLDFGSTTCSQVSTSSQISPYSCADPWDSSLYGLPTFYPIAQTYRSVH